MALVDISLASRARPVSSSRDQLLPLLPPLRPLLPRGGLQRGAVITVGTGDGTPGGTDGRGVGTGGTGGGAGLLAFALLAAASAAGSWCAAVGTGDPGILAIAEMGVDLGRLALVPGPGSAWPEVTAILVDAMDVVLVSPPGRVRSGVARRLVARARQKRTVLVVRTGPGTWPEGPDVHLTVEDGTWAGVDRGHGHLRGRHVEVAASGRRSAVRGVRTGLWLPAPSGVVAAG
ncbi:MAG TPA: hypothetical protein VN816_00510 [Acidimicrobiales bacterium]|nr:hypothetical protein [Acidimicrobiales bacterium]